jgi:hypothetical protein
MPSFGSMTFYTFDMILAGACAAFAVVAIFLHLLNHATHLSVPREQIKYAHHQRSYADLFALFDFLY